MAGAKKAKGPEGVGEVIYRARLALGHYDEVKREQVPLPYRAVAARTNGAVSASFVSMLEKGENGLRDPKRLRALALALGVSYSDLAQAAGYEGITEPRHTLNVMLRDVGLNTENARSAESYVFHLLEQQKKTGRGRKRDDGD